MRQQKGFFKFVNSKRWSKENTGLILGVKGHLTSEEEVVETSNSFPASVFNSSKRSWFAWT